jgi:hypothetical protein
MALLLAQNHAQLLTKDSVCSVRLAAFVRDQAGGVLSSAAVPRCGLGSVTPP